MSALQHAQHTLNTAELIHSEQAVNEAVNRLAIEIKQALSHQFPLVLCVMSGAAVFCGQLLPRLPFPLDFDYVHLTRYDKALRGGEIHWRMEPKEAVKDRTVLVLDDILDEGITLSAIHQKVMKNGAKAFYSAVFAEKNTDRPRPLKADFIGLTVPDRYVFGFGMDIHGAWRNLPAIYAAKES
ncbi:MAG: hypoxanthine-guanine phosphoribosyltransferase [Nitrosomonas sp.]|nr:MAG: hypoxanthine-guanine phosphoribosyltransferase [Nitrosomonas sp.]